MLTLTDFLLARIAEDEAMARAASQLLEKAPPPDYCPPGPRPALRRPPGLPRGVAAMSQPWGYTRLRDPGLRGAVARWWLRRRMARVSRALDRLKA